MIGKLLGHTQVSTTHHYAHPETDPLREVTNAGRGRDQGRWRRSVRFWFGGKYCAERR